LYQSPAHRAAVHAAHSIAPLDAARALRPTDDYLAAFPDALPIPGMNATARQREPRTVQRVDSTTLK